MGPPGALAGFAVGVTADRRWEEQRALLERRGAAVVHGATIQTLAMGEEGPLRQVTEDLLAEPPAIVIANTALGVRSWLSAADSWGVGEDLESALAASRIYARGPKASGAVHSAGLEVEAQGRTERLRDLVDLVIERVRPGDRVAVQVDGSGATVELARLAAAGADVVAVPVYRWTRPADGGPALGLAEAVIAGRIHAVTFTAGPAVRNWMAMAASSGIDAELRSALTDGRTVVGCVGPVCADAAAAEGLDSPHLVQPDAYRLGPLVRAVEERLAAQRVTVGAGSTTMVLSGRAVIVGDELITLTDTEARLLATLASRPNAVVTKESLLRAVWGAGADDPHAVEVAVARLRKRLGPHGSAVRSVHRRGYALRA